MELTQNGEKIEKTALDQAIEANGVNPVWAGYFGANIYTDHEDAGVLLPAEERAYQMGFMDALQHLQKIQNPSEESLAEMTMWLKEMGIEVVE